MPPGNITEMTGEERAQIAAWPYGQTENGQADLMSYCLELNQILGLLRC
jgi:hypothetical protein